MPVELRPVGVACNLSCQYCFQHPMREAGNIRPRSYNLWRMLAESMKGNSRRYSIFGGEALLTRRGDLERIFEFLKGHAERVGIQTNGTLINADLIALFRRYGVGIGVSIDGPGELNRYRCDAAPVLENIEAMRRAGLAVSVIVTLHRANGTPEALPRLKEFGLWLAARGIYSVNVHTLEVDTPAARECALSEAEASTAFLDLAAWLDTQGALRWQPFIDIQALLKGDDSQVNCNWRPCDPLTTSAVYGVESDGSLSNCGRMAKEGVNWVKGDTPGYERYAALHATPQEQGGCKGCRYFLLCSGGCPGEAIEGDWRNRTEHCAPIRALFRYYERKLLRDRTAPVSLLPGLAKAEAYMLAALAKGRRPSLSECLTGQPPAQQSCGNRPHGDAPHGDHNDSAR